MHVLKVTLCYPPGECHPDALLDMPPEGADLSGHYEDYEFLTSNRVPVVGSVQSFADSGDWTVMAVEHYVSDTVSDLAGVYHLLCTRGGQPLKREERSRDYTVLGLMMDGQTIVVREEGTTWADWWVGSELSIPKPSPTREVLMFTPKDPDSSYDAVVICRPVSVLQTA